MKAKQIAWGVSPQVARLIYTHMVHTRVRTRERHVGNVPRSMRKVTWSPWEPWEGKARNNSRTVGNTHTRVMRQHKWSHPVTPCDARSQGIRWSHVTQGHMTRGKAMVTEIVSLK